MSDQGVVYGNISAPRRARTKGVSFASVCVVVIGVMLTFVLMLVLRVPLAVSASTLVVTIAIAALLETGHRHGRSRPERLVAGVQHRRAKRAGATRYIAGPTSELPDGGFRAPGLLASTEMIDAVDGFGRSFGVLWDPRKRTGTVFFSAAGTGSALRDQETLDALVSGWAGYFNERATMSSLEQVSATIETTKDPGERLPRSVEASRSRADRDTVPAFATEAVDEILNEVTTSVDRIEPRIAVTLSAAGNKYEGIEPRTADELIAEIAIHLPVMIEQLEISGGGVVSMLTAQDVIDSTYVSYNPETALAVEQARLSGQGTGLSWKDVGPSYANAERTFYEHSRGFSQTFQVWQAPAGVFRENSLSAIISPDGVSEQKRVTILYRPLRPEDSQARVQKAVTDTDYEVNQKGRRATHMQIVNAQRARAAEREVSSGAALVRFSILITVTVLAKDRLPRVYPMVKNAVQTGVQLRVRSSDGNEDAAFAIGLGLGIVPGRHATFSNALREAL